MGRPLLPFSQRQRCCQQRGCRRPKQACCRTTCQQGNQRIKWYRIRPRNGSTHANAIILDHQLASIAFICRCLKSRKWNWCRCRCHVATFSIVYGATLGSPGFVDPRNPRDLSRCVIRPRSRRCQDHMTRRMVNRQQMASAWALLELLAHRRIEAYPSSPVSVPQPNPFTPRLLLFLLHLLFLRRPKSWVELRAAFAQNLEEAATVTPLRVPSHRSWRARPCVPTSPRQDPTR